MFLSLYSLDLRSRFLWWNLLCWWWNLLLGWWCLLYYRLLLLFRRYWHFFHNSIKFCLLFLSCLHITLLLFRSLGCWGWRFNRLISCFWLLIRSKRLLLNRFWLYCRLLLNWLWLGLGLLLLNYRLSNRLLFWLLDFYLRLYFWLCWLCLKLFSIRLRLWFSFLDRWLRPFCLRRLWLLLFSFYFLCRFSFFNFFSWFCGLSFRLRLLSSTFNKLFLLFLFFRLGLNVFWFCWSARSLLNLNLRFFFRLFGLLKLFFHRRLFLRCLSLQRWFTFLFWWWLLFLLWRRLLNYSGFLRYWLFTCGLFSRWFSLFLFRFHFFFSYKAHINFGRMFRFDFFNVHLKIFVWNNFLLLFLLKHWHLGLNFHLFRNFGVFLYNFKLFYGLFGTFLSTFLGCGGLSLTFSRCLFHRWLFRCVLLCRRWFVRRLFWAILLNHIFKNLLDNGFFLYNFLLFLSFFLQTSSSFRSLSDLFSANELKSILKIKILDYLFFLYIFLYLFLLVYRV